MATWYIDNVGGNDANSGTSTGTALASLRGMTGKSVASMDTVRIKRTAVPYTLTPTAIPTTDIIITSISTGIILIDSYEGDTVMPDLIYNKDILNPTFGCFFVAGSTKVYTNFLNQKWIYTGTNNAINPFAWSQTNNSQSFTYEFNGKKEFFKSDNPTVPHVAQTGGSGGNGNFNTKILHTGGRFTGSNSYTNCWGILNQTTAIGPGLSTSNKFIYNAMANNDSLANMVITYLQNNTILFVKDFGGGTYSGLTFLTHPATTNAWNTSNLNNLFVTKSSGFASIYGYRTTSAVNVPPGLNGFNCFGGLTSKTNNITGDPDGLNQSSLTSFYETLFKSLDPDSPDFLIVDETITGVDLYIRGKGMNGADIGARLLTPIVSGSDYTFDQKMVDQVLGIV